jgi:hypothetical protein
MTDSLRTYFCSRHAFKRFRERSKALGEGSGPSGGYTVDWSDIRCPACGDKMRCDACSPMVKEKALAGAPFPEAPDWATDRADFEGHLQPAEAGSPGLAE